MERTPVNVKQRGAFVDADLALVQCSVQRPSDRPVYLSEEALDGEVGLV